MGTNIMVVAVVNRGGHEIRCWIATAAAMQALSAPAPRLALYRTIPEWVAGFAVATQGPV